MKIIQDKAWQTVTCQMPAVYVMLTVRNGKTGIISHIRYDIFAFDAKITCIGPSLKKKKETPIYHN